MEPVSLEKMSWLIMKHARHFHSLNDVQILIRENHFSISYPPSSHRSFTGASSPRTAETIYTFRPGSPRIYKPLPFLGESGAKRRRAVVNLRIQLSKLDWIPIPQPPGF